MPDSDWCFTPAYRIAAAVRAREVSPIDIITAHLDRIQRNDRAILSYVALRAEEAIDEAKDLERRLAQGEPVGPLAGVPVGVKDVEDVRGLPTTYGSAPFTFNIARADSTNVARLRGAGAIPLGKTNTPEFAYAGFTKNLVFGVTRNPWDVRLTPGGSSGGSAAAVAAGMAALGTGTDRGGSLRIPASYSGLFGLKPTYGRVPRGPTAMLDWSDTESVGCLARSVVDLAAYLDAAAGYHPTDPDSLPDEPADYLATIEEISFRPRIGYTESLGYARVDADVASVCRQALAAFGPLAFVEESDVDLPDVREDWLAITAPERYAALHHVLLEHEPEMGRAFVARVKAGVSIDAERYGEAQRVRARLHERLAQFFQHYDILATPTTATVAFLAEGRLPETIGGELCRDPLEVTPFTYPFNMSGHPAISLPAGLTESGLPAGLQLVAPKYQERLLLQIARAFEQVAPPPAWPSEIAAPPGASPINEQ